MNNSVLFGLLAGTAVCIAALCSELASARRFADQAQNHTRLLLVRLRESEAERVRLMNKLAGGDDGNQ